MTTWVRRLIAINVVVFLLSLASQNLVWDFGFIPRLILQRPWTVITYMFLHSTQGIMHIGFNMLALYFFGPRLEDRLGGKHFISLYLVSGLVGALLQALFQPSGIIIGASGAVFGVTLGFARYWPRERIYIWGVLPVEARVLVIFMTVMSLWGIRGLVSPGVAHFAHLGGFVGAFIYLKILELRSPARRFKAQAAAVPLVTTPLDVQRWRRISRDGLHPVNRDELDRILAKLETSGAGSLTLDEKAFLDRFSKSAAN